MEVLRVHEVLGYGAIGLGLLLAVLAFRLLRREQQQGSLRAAMLRAVYAFMAFSLVLTLAGFWVEARRDVLERRLEARQAMEREIAASLAIILEQKELAALESRASREIRGHIRLLKASLERLRAAPDG